MLKRFRSHFRLIVLAVAAGALAGSEAAALPVPEDSAICSFDHGLRFSNPLSMRQTSGELRSPRPGRVDCSGQLRGRTVDGVGTINVHGIYGNADEWYMTGGDDCLRGSATVFFKARIPQALVPFDQRFITISGSITYRRVGAVWRGTGIAREATGPYNMSVNAIARHSGRGRQDCLTRPLARALLSGRLVIRSAS